MTSTLAPYAGAARAVLDPAHLRDALRPARADTTLAAAVRCAAAVALAILACVAVGHRELSGFASLGALASLYGRWEPYRRRAGLLATMGLVLVAVITLSSVAAAEGVGGAGIGVLAAVVATGATFLCGALGTGAPGATIVVFAVGAGFAGNPALGDVPGRALAAVVGAVLAWAVCCSGWLLYPAGPARVAVRRAARAVDAGTPRAGELVDRARDVLADDASHARGARSTAPLVALVAELEAALGRTPTPLPARRTLRDTARVELPRTDRRGLARVLGAGLVSGGLAAATGSHHGAWAVMGSTATLQGTSTAHSVTRGLQRAAGTAVGALIAWPLLEAHLPFAAVAALVVVLQLVTEVVVMRHYGLAMLTITPMALLMTSLGGVADPTTLAVDRVVGTALGAAVAVVALVAVPVRARA